MEFLAALSVLLSGAALLPLQLWEGTAAQPGHHILTFRSMANTNTPEMIMLWMLDDTLLMYYDSDIQKINIRQDFMEKNVDAEFWKTYALRTKVLHQQYKQHLEIAMEQTNRTQGTHVYQEIVACELRHDGSTAGYVNSGFDGVDFLVYDKSNLKWNAMSQFAQLTAEHWSAESYKSKSCKMYLEQECVEKLKKYLKFGKESLQRKVLPEVKVSARKTSDGKSVTLSCLVSGFYPRAIQASWYRNGRTKVKSLEFSGILPNADETFQLKKRIEILMEDKNSYSCEVEHSSAEDIMKISWDGKITDPSHGRELRPAVILGAIAAVLALVITVTGIVSCRRRRQESNKRASLMERPITVGSSDSEDSSLNSAEQN